jgi:hypothetical protein
VEVDEGEADGPPDRQPRTDGSADSNVHALRLIATLRTPAVYLVRLFW